MYLAFRFILYIFSKINIFALRKVGAFIGSMAWYVLPERRMVAIKNATFIGVPDPVKTAKTSFKNTFTSYIEISHAHEIDAEFVKKYVTVEGEEHFNKVRNGKYAIVNAHIGAWDLSGPVFTQKYNTKILLVGMAGNSEAINKIIMSSRNGGQVRYAVQEGFLEKAAQYEKEGYITGSLLDHSTVSDRGVVADFFGMRVYTLAGIPAYCARKNIPLLPAYLIRTEDGFRIVFDEPIYPDTTLKPRERILTMCNIMNQCYERIIRRFPEQWYLLHRRFKKKEEQDGKMSGGVY